MDEQTYQTVLANWRYRANECEREGGERGRRLAAGYRAAIEAAEGTACERLRRALIHTRRMVMMHHAIGECRVCMTESGRQTWDEGDAALAGAPDPGEGA